MSDHSGQQIVMLTTIWRWKKLGRYKQRINKDHTFHVEGFNLKKLNEVVGKEQLRVEVSNGFAAFEDLDAEVEINNA
jgi:hypothetical protein